MKILQINVTANWGSTGRIAEEIGNSVIAEGGESWIAYGRGNPTSNSNLIRISNDLDMKFHGLQTRLFDNHGLASVHVTKNFIKEIENVNPDLIHLHNIHGYYLNYEILFEYLKKWGGPVVWTLHDCWTFTGHCSHYAFIGCDKWKKQCLKCPQTAQYPKSLIKDNSFKNFIRKKEAFTDCPNLTLVPVSQWLNSQIKHSFLCSYPSIVIHNGVNTQVFRPTVESKEKKLVIGVASVWNERKGLDDFISLRKLLPPDFRIILVGLTHNQIKNLTDGIIGIKRTENISELVDLFSKASVFVNPTLEDTFPTTNLEALACGTPVITYDTGGSPEAVDKETGIVVPSHNISILAQQVGYVCDVRPFSIEACRQRAVKLFNSASVYEKYINLYNKLLEQ